MTRAALLTCIAELEAAAKTEGSQVHAVIGDPATEAQITQLEAALRITLPMTYRESLRAWNGCSVEIREAPDSGADRGAFKAKWVILDIRTIVAATEVVREQMTVAMFGSDVADQMAETMSRTAVIVYEDDICVFLLADDHDHGDTTVRCMNLEYALGQFPPTLHVIAASPDDYIAKGFAHLAKTLETEIYWW